MSPHYNVLSEAVCCCLRNYDQSLVVTDTITTFQVFILKKKMKNFAHQIHYDGRRGPILILSILPYLVRFFIQFEDEGEHL